MTSVLKKQYDEAVVKELAKDLGRENVHSLPKLQKVSVAVGIGKIMTQGNKDYSFIEENIASITGQKADVRRARISVSNFKLREGVPVGLTTTLRGQRMYDFVYKLVNVVLPRVRDFQGISVKGFDGNGNYSLGVKDSTIFPSLNPENMNKVHGLQINVNTSAKNDYEGYLLLKKLGFPFKDEVKKPTN